LVASDWVMLVPENGELGIVLASAIDRYCRAMLMAL
jgi:hypothetical protein